MRISEPYFTRGFKPLVFLLLLTPAFLLAYGYWQDSLGANPIEILRRSTGEWTLNSLLLTLLVSPLRRIIKWTQLIKLRRMLGLYSFFYACLHVITYIWLDQLIHNLFMTDPIHFDEPKLGVRLFHFSRASSERFTRRLTALGLRYAIRIHICIKYTDIPIPSQLRNACACITNMRG